MATVRFSKQYVQPNPIEVDYWVDLATNPYGAIIKYHNGEDWEQLNGSDGTASDFDFYNKTQINKMLANKADVSSVESKVDDDELAEVIKNIQINEIGDTGMELVIFKYDDTKVAVTIPTATATNPGVLSGEDFANFVKQNQLQSLYSEMYDLLADIRSKYQLKLTAGKNISIDRATNTISATSTISQKWSNLEDVPDFKDVATSGDYNDLINTPTAEDILTELKTVDGTGSGLDADTLDGYNTSLGATANSVAIRDSIGGLQVSQLKYQPLVFSPSTSGWYRVYTGMNYMGATDNVILNIRCMPYEDYTFSINAAYSEVLITQLSGEYCGTQYVTSIRVVKETDYKYHVDIYTSASSYRHYVNGIGVGTCIEGTLVTATDGVVYTFNPVSGFKAQRYDSNGGKILGDSIYGDLTGGIIKQDNNTGIFVKSTAGYYYNAMYFDNSNVLNFGLGTAASGYKTELEGYTLTFKYGTSGSIGMMMNQYGNVTIGSSSDLAGTTKDFYVYGKSALNGNVSIGTGNTSDYALYVNGDTSITSNLSVYSNIDSGDYCDWYGVSWSENSSSPTCTRIGNMALHRSLPIHNAMKGYLLLQAVATEGETFYPLSDDWSTVLYSSTDNGTTLDTTNGNIVVKIPEFWYIDEYEPSTKTHNLKISQTAKAGWCHHKEAYVGAYEGYNDGTYYRSIKDVVPTVSVTRTTLRSLARANGYEEESKWNIYTYEEHRAICHLFLVEYATRNSQLSVSSSLTSAGFKRGGLGSGCTTGTVTNNGVTTYSFVPTGVTHTLGNGSGQVSYTYNNTDSSGNVINTVTKYANRYRGIENPFGHIWKHVDDIVNIYDSSNGNKTVYKCDKPEYFETNKNAKYKPLCSFPGGTARQDYSKEIKATINCDFFKCSVGGSESTYWCDYNYDNDDTTEHCLLIGGCSGDGGAAGLFYFNLNHGVGYSAVYIGSRLTYLPWAE